MGAYTSVRAFRLLTLAAMTVFGATVTGAVGNPADLKAAEIVSWNWKKDPSWGSNGIIHWTVQVKNKSDRNIQFVKIELSTYDAKEKIVSTTSLFVNAIPVGALRATESFADLYGNETDARVQIVDVEFAN